MKLPGLTPGTTQRPPQDIMAIVNRHKSSGPLSKKQKARMLIRAAAAKAEGTVPILLLQAVPRAE
jgi:hypothetical protein